jgi:hypothetical protein
MGVLQRQAPSSAYFNRACGLLFFQLAAWTAVFLT